MNTKIKICPNCGSTNIGLIGGGSAPPKEFCKDCNFGKISENISNFPEIETKELKAFKEKIKNLNDSLKNR